MTTPTPCDEWIERLSPYADGELLPADRSAVEQHLSGCEACRAWLEAVEEDARLYAGAYAEPERGGAYLEGVMAKVPSVQPARGVRRTLRSRLMELLVLGGIVVVLAAIFTPTLNFARAREKARQASCQSNLKQLALGMLMFAQDHGGMLPSASGWDKALYPDYIDNRDLFRCPLDRSGQSCSYAMNYQLSQADLDTLADREQQILLYDAYESGAPAKRHNEGLNIAFADGHVKWFRDPPKPVTGGVSLGANDRNYGLADKLHLSYDAALTVETDDALASLRSGEEVVREQGGFVLQADFRQAERLATATLTCKVPAENLEVTLAAFQALGATVSQQLAGQDLTQQFVDVQTALRREQDKHTRLSREASRTREPNETAALRASIEQSEERTLDDRRKQYEVLSRTVLSTVCATFQSPVPRPSAKVLTASALQSGWHWSGRTLGVAGAWALGFAPVWVPVVLLAWVGRVWLRRRSMGRG